MKIYIVQGETGEHSDKVTWPVCAHRTLEGAHVKKKMFEVWAQLHGILNDDTGDVPRERNKTAAAAWFQIWPMYQLNTDYTGTMWDVIELEYNPDEQIPGTGVV